MNNILNLNQKGKIELIDAKGYRSDVKLFFENQVEREWLNTKEAAHYMGVTENALRIMVHRGQIQAYSLGRRLRFRFSDCRALFKKKGA